MSNRKETADQSTCKPMENTLAEEPQARIQKIHQEGSKSTYVIIVNKDCLKSDSALKSLVNTKQAPASTHGRILPRRSLLQTSDVKKKLTILSDREFDSPTDSSTATRSLIKPNPKPEDVKLNLSHINDEEYDSGLTSSSVFLKSEQSSSAFDSAIETDMSKNSSFEPTSRSLLSNLDSMKMNAYVIPSPLSTQQTRSEETQHAFQVVNSKTTSKLAYNTPVSTNKNVAYPTARKIIHVPDSNATECAKTVKKTIHYTSQAVPLAHKSIGTPVSLGYQRHINPNAVPVFSDISPIQAGGDNRFSPLTMGTFVPVAPSPKAYYAGDNKGPFTSTPVDTNPRITHLKHESSTHRPVYIIQPPFKKKSEPNASTASIAPLDTGKAGPVRPAFSDVSVSELENNSSGFVSASDSLEKTESTSYIQIIDVRSLVESKDDEDSWDMKPEFFSQTDSVKDSVSSAAGSVVSESEDVGVKQEDGESQDTGLELECEAEPSVTSSQESEPGENVDDKGCLNRSLTNIQWLKGMQLKEKVPTSTSSSSNSKEERQMIQWKCLTPEDIKKISEECGRDRRPPFSYMAMIQMALYSREDRKMMLKEITKWIEDTFPYYRYCGKQGWKNSIRHNLSLYNIFERESNKRHGAYWTIKPDLEPKTKQYKDRYKDSGNSSDTHQSMPSLPSQTPGMIPIIPMYSSMGQLSAISPQSLLAKPQTTTASRSKKKGPQPILPRPGPYGAMSPYAPQAYALIPLQSVSQSYGVSPGIPQSPVIVNLPNPGQTMSACPSPVISEMSAAVASIQVSCASPIPPESLDSQSSYESVIPSQPVNIVKQAWIDSQNMDTCSSLDSDLTSSNDVASSNEFFRKSVNRPKVKRPRDGKPSLPRPKIYKQEKASSKNIKGGSKRRKLQKERALQESSDEEDAGTKFLSSLQKGLATPSKMAVPSDTVADELLATSTPLKSKDNGASPELPSPIQGLTPLRTAGLFDGSFLDLIDKKAMSPDLGAKKYSPESHIKISPNTSLDFNILDKCNDSPSSSNQNLSRFLNEYCIDPNLADSAENFPSLNWSVVQQMVDNMDTDQN